MAILFGVALACAVLILVCSAIAQTVNEARFSPSEKCRLGKYRKWGPLNPIVECPACHRMGSVRIKTDSLIIAGMKGQHTMHAHCENCANDWQF